MRGPVVVSPCGGQGLSPLHSQDTTLPPSTAPPWPNLPLCALPLPGDASPLTPCSHFHCLWLHTPGSGPGSLGCRPRHAARTTLPHKLLTLASFPPRPHRFSDYGAWGFLTALSRMVSLKHINHEWTLFFQPPVVLTLHVCPGICHADPTF